MIKGRGTEVRETARRLVSLFNKCMTTVYVGLESYSLRVIGDCCRRAAKTKEEWMNSRDTLKEESLGLVTDWIVKERKEEE